MFVFSCRRKLEWLWIVIGRKGKLKMEKIRIVLLDQISKFQFDVTRHVHESSISSSKMSLDCVFSCLFAPFLISCLSPMQQGRGVNLRWQLVFCFPFRKKYFAFWSRQNGYPDLTFASSKELLARPQLTSKDGCAVWEG